METDNTVPQPTQQVETPPCESPTLEVTGQTASKPMNLGDLQVAGSTCPFCREVVNAKARICKYCHSGLTPTRKFFTWVTVILPLATIAGAMVAVWGAYRSYLEYTKTQNISDRMLSTEAGTSNALAKAQAALMRADAAEIGMSNAFTKAQTALDRADSAESSAALSAQAAKLAADDSQLARIVTETNLIVVEQVLIKAVDAAGDAQNAKDLASQYLRDVTYLYDLSEWDSTTFLDQLQNTNSVQKHRIASAQYLQMEEIVLCRVALVKDLRITQFPSTAFRDISAALKSEKVVERYNSILFCLAAYNYLAPWQRSLKAAIVAHSWRRLRDIAEGDEFLLPRLAAYRVLCELYLCEKGVGNKAVPLYVERGQLVEECTKFFEHDRAYSEESNDSGPNTQTRSSRTVHSVVH